VEFALVLPLFVMVLVGIITLGIGVFYQQQLANAAREAARYGVIHSATSDCPTVAWLDPDVSRAPKTYYRCDPPPTWPYMSAFARNAVFGMAQSDIHLAACWSGYWTKDNLGNWGAQDAAASPTTYFRPCTIAGVDPRTNMSSLACPSTTTAADDMASDLASSSEHNANQVTVYACYEWRPPLAGFLLIPQVVHMRAVVTQGLEYQQ
jgi:TadE-like protein.